MIATELTLWKGLYMSHDTVDPGLIAEKLGRIKRKYVVFFLGSIPIDPGFVSLSDSGKVYVDANGKSPVSEVMFRIASSL